MRLLASTKQRVPRQTGLVEGGGGRQDVAHHAVPAHHIGGIHINDVTRAERETVGQQQGIRRAAIQMEELGLVAVATHHVDPLGVGLVLGDVAGIGQRLGQRGALLGHDQRTGLLYGAQHKDLVEAAVLHVEDVAVLQKGVLLRGAILVHGLDVHPEGGALAGEQHAAVVGLGAKTTGLIDGFEHRHRHIRDRELARLGHLAHHVDALAAEGGNPHVQLHALDELSQAGDQHLADLARCLAGHLQRAHVGVVDGAVFVHHGTGLVCRSILAGRSGELGVIPDDDGQHVAGANLVIRHHGIGAGRLAASRAHVAVGGGGALSGGKLHLLDDQLGGDRLDRYIGRRGLGRVGLAHWQLDRRLLVAQAVGLVTGNYSARPQARAHERQQQAAG